MTCRQKTDHIFSVTSAISIFFLARLVNAIPTRLTNFCESIFFFLFFSFFFKLFGWELIIVCIFLFTGSWAYIRGEGLFVGECAYKQTFTVGKLSVGRRPKKMSCTGGVVHLNSHRNKIIMFRYKVRCRYKQSNWRKGVPHGPFWITIREVLFFGQVVAQLVTKGINATLRNNLKRSQGIVRNKSGIKLLNRT